MDDNLWVVKVDIYGLQCQIPELIRYKIHYPLITWELKWNWLF